MRSCATTLVRAWPHGSHNPLPHCLINIEQILHVKLNKFQAAPACRLCQVKPQHVPTCRTAPVKKVFAHVCSQAQHAPNATHTKQTWKGVPDLRKDIQSQGIRAGTDRERCGRGVQSASCWRSRRRR